MLRVSIRTVSWIGIASMILFAWLPQSVPRASAQDADKAKDKIKALLEERAAVARDAVREAKKPKDFKDNPDEVIAANRLELEAALDLCETDKERIATLEKALPVAKEIEKIIMERLPAGAARIPQALAAKAERLRIEIALEKAKAKAPAQGPQDVQDELELAKKRADIRRAAVKVVAAQKARVVANLGIAKADVDKEKAEVLFAEAQLKRIEALAKANAVDASLKDEHRAKYEAARARLHKAESALREADAQIAIEDARIDQAQLEFEEAELRVKQLKGRLGN